MKIQLFKNGNTYRTVVFDESKMMPDPKFARVSDWNGLTPVPDLEPQKAGETDGEFAARKKAHDDEVAAEPARITQREAQIQVEAQRLYEAEFNKLAEVLLSEKVV